jgi:HEAT repeat protein
MEQFEQAQSTYDKVLALSALGNAGIDSCTPQLEQIIKDKSEQRVVRVKAIDALRRLRTQQPQQIQQILLPIYQNARDQPQVRTAAFAILMYTKPQQSVLDQLVYTIANEPNKQVQAFAYRTMKMLANSRSPVDQQM